MATVFLNGRFVDDAAQASVSALDAGLQHGVGLFETMLGVRGRAEPVVLGLEHVRRLIASAQELGLSGELRESALYEAVVETFRRSGLERARVRLTVSGGDLNMLAREGVGGGAQRGSDPTVLIVAQAATAYPAAMLEAGVLATIAGARANALNPFEGHKTLNYWWRLSELRIAAAKQAGEALVFDGDNRLVGGCVSNVFLVMGGELHTPQARGDDAPERVTDADPLAAASRSGKGEPGAPPSAALPGITRQWAVHTAAGRGVLTRRRVLTVNELLAAEEVFLTNSSWGVLPVVRVEAHAVGAGVPGPITRQLIEDWASETKPLV